MISTTHMGPVIHKKCRLHWTLIESSRGISFFNRDASKADCNSSFGMDKTFTGSTRILSIRTLYQFWVSKIRARIKLTKIIYLASYLSTYGAHIDQMDCRSSIGNCSFYKTKRLESHSRNQFGALLKRDHLIVEQLCAKKPYNLGVQPKK